MGPMSAEPQTGRHRPPTATVVTSGPDPRTREPGARDDRNEVGRSAGSAMDQRLGRVLSERHDRPFGPLAEPPDWPPCAGTSGG